MSESRPGVLAPLEHIRQKLEYMATLKAQSTPGFIDPMLTLQFVQHEARELLAALPGLGGPQEPDSLEQFLQWVLMAQRYTNVVVVESDGYPMLHSADDIRTLLVNAFLAGMKASASDDLHAVPSEAMHPLAPKGEASGQSLGISGPAPQEPERCFCGRLIKRTPEGTEP